MRADRVSTDDLATAVTWLGAFEGEDGHPLSHVDHAPADDDETQAALRRVMVWIERERQTRIVDAAVRSMARETGRAPSREHRAALIATRTRTALDPRA